MSALAKLLRARREAIVARFRERLPATLGPGAARAEGELIDLLPDRLDDVADALERATSPGASPLATGGPAEARGRQRLRLGFDLGAVVRELDLLRDCIDEAVDAAGVEVSMGELRALSGRLAADAADAADQYAAGRQRGLEAERRAAESALRASEERYRTLFASIDDGFCLMQMIVDEAGETVDYRFLETNGAFEGQTGLKGAHGKTARELVPDLDASWFKLYGDVARTGEPARFENHAPAMGRWFDVYANRVGAPEQRLVALVFKDVTARKAVEAEREALLVRERAARDEAEAARKNQHDLFMQAPVPVAILEGVDHTFAFANPAYRALVNGRDVVGKALDDALPDVRGMGFDRLLDQVMSTGETFVAKEMPIKLGHHVGDEVLMLDFVYTPKRNAAGQIDGVLVSGWDVTKLVQARQQAEASNRLKDEFLTTISHELRTPLTAILGWVKMLRAGPMPAERRERALETIERNARAQARLIEDLLDVSRILAGKLRLEVAPVEVGAVVNQALETVRPAAEARGVRLQAALDAGALVMGDAGRLQQTVWNLLSNAVKFTPKGGRVQVTVEQDDSSVEVTVADTGQGIAPEFLPYVFDRFRQADGSTTRAHGGLGLGLSLVRHLVELHGGVVRVTSDGEGRGATFTVRLPLAVRRGREASPPPDAREALAANGILCPPELEGLRVLVVDDEDDTREMLRTLLEGCGARVRVAASAAEALRSFDAERPQVILSDVGLPGEDGYELIRQVRTLPSAAPDEVPAAALTAYARAEDRTRALLAGFQSHVTKPVEPTELLAVIASLAGRRPTEAP